MKLHTVLFLLTLVFCVARADDAEVVVTPTPEQIDVLLSKKQFAPALSLIRRVPQGDRNAAWEKQVEKASVGQLVTLAKENPLGSSPYAIALKKEFPLLRRSKPFGRMLEELSLADLRFCFSSHQDGTECAEKLFTSLQESNEPMPFYLGIAQLVAGGAGVGAAMPFVELGEQRATGPGKGCLQKEAQSLLLLGLQLPPGEGRKKAQALVTGPCNAKMIPLLKHASGTNPHLKQALCEISLCPKS